MNGNSYMDLWVPLSWPSELIQKKKGVLHWRGPEISVDLPVHNSMVCMFSMFYMCVKCIHVFNIFTDKGIIFVWPFFLPSLLYFIVTVMFSIVIMCWELQKKIKISWKVAFLNCTFFRVNWSSVTFLNQKHRKEVQSVKMSN